MATISNTVSNRTFQVRLEIDNEPTGYADNPELTIQANDYLHFGKIDPALSRFVTQNERSLILGSDGHPREIKLKLSEAPMSLRSGEKTAFTLQRNSTRKLRKGNYDFLTFSYATREATKSQQTLNRRSDFFTKGSIQEDTIRLKLEFTDGAPHLTVREETSQRRKACLSWPSLCRRTK
ncbi:MAG: hypothetical protein S4CHLAM6_13680 [Chlamydiae bacterium]|nr:hypothetical protein [Chlamydiota bacterium]